MEPVGTRAVHLRASDAHPSIFLDAFGRTDRQMVPERDHSPNLAQAMHMLAGATYTDKLSRRGGRLERLIAGGASDREIIEEVSLAALGRFPTEEEQSGLQELVGARASRRQAFEDLLWGLMNSREFMTIH